MGCKAAIQVARCDEAILVPKSAVKVLDRPHRGYVYVQSADGSQEKRGVRTGRLHEKRWEILSGLKDGEQLIAKIPMAVSKNSISISEGEPR